MKQARKSRGVSWAHGANLCQVKLFSSEDCPSKVGLHSQDHLQAKASGMMRPYTVELNDCPPGFEVTCLRGQLDLSHIPLANWKCPPVFVLGVNWRVAAGEESNEMGSQKLREMRVFEAVYPRASSIPSCASVSHDTEDESYDDSHTPLVPVIPIEEDESADNMDSDSAAAGNMLTSSITTTMASNIQSVPTIPDNSTTTNTSSMEKAPPVKLTDVGADIAAAAASTALAVLMKSNEQGSMIDTNLLIKFLSDPKMIQNLANLPLIQADSGNALSTMKPVESASLPVTKLATAQIEELPNGNLHPRVSNGGPSTVTTRPQMATISSSNVKPASISGPSPAPDVNKVNILVPNTGNYNNAQPKIRPVTTVRKETQTIKDMNYYKNLVRQHGEQRRINEKNHGQIGNNHHNLHNLNMKVENFKPKIQKPCIYFNGPKGCRNGVNCSYKHDTSLNWRTSDMFENQNAKRMKFCGEITGST